MPSANWYSMPDRDMPSFGSFDPSHIADDDTRFILERIREELAQFGRGCEKPLYGLRAHCWMPDVGRVKYGYYMAEYNETVLSAPLDGKRVVVLPDAVLRQGGSVEVVDRTGNAGTINITIKTIKAQTINRAATYAVNTNGAGVVFRSDGENWWAIASSPGGSTGAGNVVGPAGAVDNAIARYDSTTGKLIQNSLATVDDSGNIDAPNLRNTLHFPPGQQVAVADGSVVTAFADGDTFFVYLGRARAAITSVRVRVYVTTAYAGGGGGTPWAEVGVFTGIPIAPAADGGLSPGPTSLTRVGYVDVSSNFTSTGRRNADITVSGVAAGDHLWAAFGSGAGGGANTIYQLAGGVADLLITGQYQDVTGRPSTLSTPQSVDLVGATVVPPWIAIYW